MIRLGIVGCNYGRTVQLPAFRADPRCEVIALASSNVVRAAEFARAANVPKAYGDWRGLVEDDAVQAVAIATMPALQAQIAVRALDLGKPVFETTTVGTVGPTTRLGGYSFVTADDLEAAATMAKGCPFVGTGGGVEVGLLGEPRG